jgi:SOS-response transcriptional repressor LexA
MEDMKARIARRLRERREKLDWTRTKVATLAQISQGFYSRIEQGTARASDDVLLKLAGALGLPVDRLYATESNVEETVMDFRAIPILEYEQLADWSTVEDFPAFLTRTPHRKLPMQMEAPPSTFALRIKDDSMLPRFTTGDNVIIDPTRPPQPGNFVVAKDGLGDSVFRQYRTVGLNLAQGMTFELVPLNPVYGSLRSDREPIAVIGVMIEHRTYRLT